MFRQCYFAGPYSLLNYLRVILNFLWGMLTYLKDVDLIKWRLVYLRTSRSVLSALYKSAFLFLGDIRVYKRLDREKISTYRITGNATDGPGLYCSTDIVLELTDVNDNSPVFDQSVYSYTLPEDSANNTLLLRVKATDKDTGE